MAETNRANRKFMKPIQEKHLHDICPKCKIASVPVDGVPDQAFRGCPQCHRVWTEDTSRPPKLDREKVTLKKLSACACGFQTLKDGIALDTEYEVNKSTAEKVDYVCGGCGKTTSLTAIWVYARGDGRGGFLPKSLFDNEPVS
jgi:hypothetical protein